ncbi:MAG: alpha/beta fold hydrolase [Mangrovicoccus sp.]|nr:alpha/beta fold hydrolase [Mangrovicoccus sp.]
MKQLIFGAALMLSQGGALPAMARCAEDLEAVCQVETGRYHVALPDGQSGPVPAVLFLHGWGSNGANALGNAKIAAPILARGYALITPDGLPRSTGNGGTWSFHPDWPQARDEIAFFKEVIKDAAAQHGVDPAQVILTGFSIGGSMTAYAACQAPELFAAYAPLGGNFWRPHPESCAGPVRMLHSHGWSDTVVPLEGRYLRDGQIAQGDIFAAMEIWRAANGCDALRADHFEMTDRYWRRKWDRCAPGSDLELALFPAGHIIPEDWPEMMLDWVEGN